MGRSSRVLLAALLGGMIFASGVTAGIPDPALSDVPNVVVSPDGGIDYLVTVIATDGPVASALVQVVMSTETDGLVCWCVGQTHPTIEATTDANGVATFTISGGGCVDPSAVASPPAVEVFANGIKLAEVGVVSPDVVDLAGKKATDVGGWDPLGTCGVSGGDAVYHTSPIASGIYDFCTDLNSDLVVNVTDAVLVTQPISGGASCTAQ